MKKKAKRFLFFLIFIILVIGVVAIFSSNEKIYDLGYSILEPIFGENTKDIIGERPNNTPEIPDDSTNDEQQKPNDSGSNNTETPPVGNTYEIVEEYVYEDFQIHFIRMGNSSYSSDYSKYSGDSIYIQANGNDILIDAGSRQGSAGYIKDYVDKYCKDGVLEYVIATHADQDHISGFVGTNAYPGIFEAYKIETLIDFTYSDKDLTTSSGGQSLYGKYAEGRNQLLSNGTKCYTAKECFNEENGAKSKYSLGENISFEVIYNYYYFNKASDENDHSVCTLFTYNNLNFLFTGDLEEKGEEKLAEYYDKSTPGKTLPHCVLYKAGHHGSKTSSNDCLLDLITPEICCVCCCAGSVEYTKNYKNVFPTQDFINRIAKHTDRVYVTSVINEKTDEPEEMNGDIIISSNGIKVAIDATNNIIKLKDTEWFNETVYVKSDNTIADKNGFFTSETAGVIAVKRRIWPI